MVMVRIKTSIRQVVPRLAAYMWAAPNSVLGLLAGIAVLSCGGRVRFVSGAVEFHGGLLGRLFATIPGRLAFRAITLGHLILGVSHVQLSKHREHEQVHDRK